MGTIWSVADVHYWTSKTTKCENYLECSKVFANKMIVFTATKNVIGTLSFHWHAVRIMMTKLNFNLNQPFFCVCFPFSVGRIKQLKRLKCKMETICKCKEGDERRRKGSIHQTLKHCCCCCFFFFTPSSSKMERVAGRTRQAVRGINTDPAHPTMPPRRCLPTLAPSQWAILGMVMRRTLSATHSVREKGEDSFVCKDDMSLQLRKKALPPQLNSVNIMLPPQFACQEQTGKGAVFRSVRSHKE